MISAANFHSCFGRWNSTGRYLNFNEIVVRQLRVGHSDYRFMRINEMAEMDGGCWRCRGDGEADVERSMRCSMAASSRATSPGAARRRDIVSVRSPFAGWAALPASRRVCAHKLGRAHGDQLRWGTRRAFASGMSGSVRLDVRLRYASQNRCASRQRRLGPRRLCA